MGADLVRVFGYWLWWIFRTSLVLLVDGIAAIQTARALELPLARKMGLLASSPSCGVWCWLP